MEREEKRAEREGGEAKVSFDSLLELNSSKREGFERIWSGTYPYPTSVLLVPSTRMLRLPSFGLDEGGRRTKLEGQQREGSKSKLTSSSCPLAVVTDDISAPKRTKRGLVVLEGSIKEAVREKVMKNRVGLPSKKLAILFVSFSSPPPSIRPLLPGSHSLN